MTDAELTAGIIALESYVKGIDPLEAIFAPTSIYQTAVTDIVTAADGSADQTPAGRQAAAQVAMRAAINSAGYGSDISDQECHDGTAVVLAAVNKAVALAVQSFMSASLSEES